MTMSSNGYKFYMQEVTKENDEYIEVENTQKDLENDFVGLKYAKCEGIDKMGKPRIYTESYADSDRLRAYVPNELTNDATNITFTFYFVGNQRRETYYNFIEYVRQGIHAYWDNVRNRKFYFVVASEIKPASEMWYGSSPYLELNLQVQNLNGKTFEV